jgi:hypothetical protein
MKNEPGLLPLGDILKQASAPGGKGVLSKLHTEIQAAAKPLTRVQNRLLEPCPEHDGEICFQHSVLCQTGLPYRNPGEDIRHWQRTQGNAMLVVQAGEVLQPQTGTTIEVGLPWGPKPRLILAHLNAEALRLGSPEIAVQDSLSAFVKRIRGFDGGREIRMFKDQLTRLSTAFRTSGSPGGTRSGHSPTTATVSSRRTFAASGKAARPRGSSPCASSPMTWRRCSTFWASARRRRFAGCRWAGTLRWRSGGHIRRG